MELDFLELYSEAPYRAVPPPPSPRGSTLLRLRILPIKFFLHRSYLKSAQSSSHRSQTRVRPPHYHTILIFSGPAASFCGQQEQGGSSGKWLGRRRQCKDQLWRQILGPGVRQRKKRIVSLD